MPWTVHSDLGAKESRRKSYFVYTSSFRYLELGTKRKQKIFFTKSFSYPDLTVLQKASQLI